MCTSYICLLVFVLWIENNVVSAQNEVKLSHFMEQGKWILPSDRYPAMSVCGYKDGIRIGIAPPPPVPGD